MREILYQGEKAWLTDDGRLFGVCAACNKFIQLNKRWLGDLHICPDRGLRS
jgi:hypothetical protein